MRVITWNIAALPYPFNQFKNDNTRQNAIISVLKQLNADIICLQEVFSQKMKDNIIAGLLEYKCYTSNPKTCLGLNAGLLIAIKKKINVITSEFYQFKNSTGEDKFGNKGVLKLIVNLNGKLVSIYNTHLQANSKYFCHSDNYNVRQKQLEELRLFLDNNDKIICGDFNSYYDNVTNVLDIYNHLDIDLKTPTTIWKNIIDFIFVCLSFTDLSSSYNVGKTQLSDHYIVYIDFDLIY